MNSRGFLKPVAAAFIFLALAGCGGNSDSGISDGGGYLNDLWQYDGSVWTSVPLAADDTPPSARRDHTTVVIGGKIYIFGGFGGTYLNDLWSYDTTDGWTQIKPPTETPSADIPSARRGHTAVVYLDKMYVFGGFNGANLNDLWEFDPSEDITRTNPWRKISPESGNTPPSARRFHTAIVNGTKMYVFGGFGTSILNELWIYDFDSNLWEPIPASAVSWPPARNGHSAVVSGTSMFIFGGWTKSGNNYVALNDVWAYDLGGLEGWQETLPNDPNRNPSPRGVHSAVMFGGSMLIFGGYDIARLNELWSFDLANTTWSQPVVTIPAELTPRFGHSAVVYNDAGTDKMFIFGGYGTPLPAQQ